MLALGQISNCYKTSSNTIQNEYAHKSSVYPQFGKSNIPSAFTLKNSGS